MDKIDLVLDSWIFVTTAMNLWVPQPQSINS